jgi:cystathionine beta-lyase
MRSDKTSRIDFDAPVERRATGSVKWDRYADDVIPLWVADMDFKAPPAIVDALHERIAHGVFGYTRPTETVVKAVCQRLKIDYHWEIDPTWLVWLPGLVTGINLACRTAGQEGDAVLTTTPVYPPFLTAPGHARRTCLPTPMRLDRGRWRLDMAALEAAVTPQTRLFLLCSPHNPTGRVFTPEELTELTDFCSAHDLIICSDEIHCQLILDEGCRHTPTATLNEAALDRTITLMAPSKTYNVPGLGCSLAIIANPALRRRFKAAMAGIVPDVNALGFTAALAGYTHGDDWLKELLAYLRGNHDRVARAIAHMPGLTTTKVEATYLSWIDTRALNLDNPAAFFEAAGVGLSDGADFGTPGFLRLNFGCPRAILEEALKRMRTALSKASQ